MRARLRAATADAHERMHLHPGFAAAAAGSIEPMAYRDLLARLYGFHVAYDEAMRKAPRRLSAELDLAARSRAPLIVEDLVALGAGRERVATLPICRDLPALDGEGAWLGAIYVIEGSTLGGAHIARALGALLPGEGSLGRRFFLGDPERRGPSWRAFVGRLDQLREDSEAAADAERAARATFAAFERWMARWVGAFSAASSRAPATA